MADNEAGATAAAADPNNAGATAVQAPDLQDQDEQEMQNLESFTKGDVAGQGLSAEQ